MQIWRTEVLQCTLHVFSSLVGSAQALMSHTLRLPVVAILGHLRTGQHNNCAEPCLQRIGACYGILRSIATVRGISQGSEERAAQRPADAP